MPVLLMGIGALGQRRAESGWELGEELKKMALSGIAAQVYSVRELAQADFAGTMKAVKECGYQGVELAGLYGLKPEEIRDCLKEQGLTAVSAHVPLEEFLRDMEGTADAYRTIGCSYIGIPWMGTERHYGGEGFEEACSLLEKISACCRERGMTLLYHNHSFEFEKTQRGTCLLDELYGALDADVLQTELDVCWVEAAGASAVEYLRRYANRCPVVHMKEFRRENDEVRLVALGQGQVDVSAVAQTAALCGASWLVVEQDDHPYGTPMENMRESIGRLREVL